MSKGLDKLQIIRHIYHSEYGEDISMDKDLDVIEKELKEGEKAQLKLKALGNFVLKSEALDIIKKYPNNRNSLANFRYMVGYWERNNIKVTKELLETYDFPFETDEYDLLKEVLL